MNIMTAAWQQHDSSVWQDWWSRDQHMGASTKWPQFGRRYFKMRIIDRQLWCFNSNFSEDCSWSSNWHDVNIIEMVAWWWLDPRGCLRECLRESFSALLALCEEISPLPVTSPIKKAVIIADLWCFHFWAFGQSADETVELPVMWDAMAFMLHYCTDVDVRLMHDYKNDPFQVCHSYKSAWNPIIRNVDVQTAINIMKAK